MLEKLKARFAYLDKKRAVAALILALAILITLIFIISNSARTVESSTEQSDSFKDFVAEVIPGETDFEKAILDNIRKIAHFTEYSLLGIEVSLLLSVIADGRKKRYKFAARSTLFGLVSAFFDETVQIFSKRGPSISDVWIDVGGFVFFSLITYGAVELICLIKYLILKKRKAAENTDKNG